MTRNPPLILQKRAAYCHRLATRLLLFAIDLQNVSTSRQSRALHVEESGRLHLVVAGFAERLQEQPRAASAEETATPG